MNTCNLGFISKYARLDNISNHITIDEYLLNNYTSTPRCINHGHELIVVNGEIVRPHFRHKNCGDVTGNPMTQWHIDWQSNFPVTEKSFKNKHGQLKDRRADIVLTDYNKVIEIQHSPITNGEIMNRTNDYALHNHSVVWIIDAQNSVEIKRLDKRLILDFTQKSWLYENFLSCDTLYYDINGLIYKVNPKNVRSHQIDVSDPKIKNDFIEALKSNTDLWEKVDEPSQCNLYFKQQGAGSGKTYGLMQFLNDDAEISKFKYITFITKQHSAVYVMFSEFIKQYNSGNLSNIVLIEPTKYDDIMLEKEKDNKKHIVKYRHLLTNTETYAIFGTVDSLTYALGESSLKSFDKFIGIVKSIKEGTIMTDTSGKMKKQYGSVNPIINKEMLMIIDETQDLTQLYGEAFIKIVNSKYTNLCVVGDMLQSLTNENSALTYLDRIKMPLIKIIKTDISNNVRRFSDPKLIDFVNSIVPFSKYELPIMTAAVPVEAKEGALTIFSAKTVYANESVESVNVIEAIDDIMKLFSNEVETNKLFPEDFLFVTPFTKKNPIMEGLQIALNSYWMDIMQNNTDYINKAKSKNEYWNKINANKYTRYAIFHKSEEGSSINLGESERATRMVSIHSSKGDGRKIVFVIGVTQSALQQFSQVADNLIYNSLLHVAITRQKERLYFRLEKNNDDIYKRISKSGMAPSTKLSTEFDIPNKKVKLTEISDNISKFSFENDLYSNIVCKYKQPDTPFESDTKLLIDMGDHHIRYSSIFMNIMVHCANHDLKNPSNTKKQYIAIFNKINGFLLKPVDSWREYLKILEENSNNNKSNESNKKNFIPILHFDKNKNDIDYQKYFSIIFNTMTRIINELESLGNKALNPFCPLECVILYYMKECIEEGKYQKISINDVYNIINTYSRVFNLETSTGHEKCNCKINFKNKNEKLNESEIKYQKYLCNHYDRLRHINKILDNFDSDHPKVNWLYSHLVSLNSTDDFKIYKQYDMIGYDEKNVYIFYIKPQFNELNINNIIVDSILDTYNVLNIATTSNNHNKFSNKSVVSCVLSLNKQEIYYMNWTDAVKENNKYFKDMLYKSMYNKFSIKHTSYYDTFININDEMKNESPTKIIERCIIEINKDMNSPNYIKELFNFINKRLEEDSDVEEDSIFDKYKNKEYFIKKIDKDLDKSLKKFIGIDK